ncbi:hypothetical protein BDU57DRAFT_206377 [Ampelomyces quisqualis]|uniref:Uncharacterized protein n=1 Tax=Ampelomyces quisqualis TaxID=50730 RepID=A0A6A5QK94_AMPQU|nr:hypothetical protein BDU57DRAFT_206377 [Ampelomyces quisqualis]
MQRGSLALATPVVVPCLGATTWRLHVIFTSHLRQQTRAVARLLTQKQTGRKRQSYPASARQPPATVTTKSSWAQCWEGYVAGHSDCTLPIAPRPPIYSSASFRKTSCASASRAQTTLDAPSVGHVGPAFLIPTSSR